MVSDMPQPSVGVVTVNWNGLDDTVRCVESILASVGVSAIPIVVDNGSTDDSACRLTQRFPQLELIANARNDGFARGTNIGLRHAQDLGVEFVVLLNNDAYIEPGALAAMVDVIEANRADLVSGLILERRDPDVVSYAGGRIGRLRGRAVVPAEHMPLREVDVEGGRTEFVTCAFLGMRTCTLDQIGLLPEDYFFGTEEWDFALRALRARLRLWMEPSAVCVHAGAKSHPTTSARWMYSSFRNKLIFQNRYLPAGAWPIWRLAFSIYVRTVMPRLRRGLHAHPEAARHLAIAGRAALRDHFPGRRIELRDLDRIEREATSS